MFEVRIVGSAPKILQCCISARDWKTYEYISMDNSYLINHSLSDDIEKKTPQEVWSGSPATYSNLKFFGCSTYAHGYNGKLKPRSMKCISLGYKSGVKFENQEIGN